MHEIGKIIFAKIREFKFPQLILLDSQKLSFNYDNLDKKIQADQRSFLSY